MAEVKKRKPRKVSGTGDIKVLKELKKQTELLNEIKTILDNTWRGRTPQ